MYAWSRRKGKLSEFKILFASHPKNATVELLKLFLLDGHTLQLHVQESGADM